MVNRDSYLLKSWEMEQVGRTPRIDEDLVYIKAINIQVIQERHNVV